MRARVRGSRESSPGRAEDKQLLLQEPQVSFSVPEGRPFVWAVFDCEVLEDVGAYIKRDVASRFPHGGFSQHRAKQEVPFHNPVNSSYHF